MLAGVVICLVLSGPASAVEGAHLALEAISGRGWTARGVTLRLGLAAPGSPSLHLRIEAVEVPPLAPLEDVAVDCPEVSVRPGVISCRSARLSLTASGTPLTASGARVTYRRAGPGRELRVERIALASGRASLRWERENGPWALQLDGEGLALAGIVRWVSALAGIPWPLEVEGGRAGVELRAGGGDAVDKLEAQVALRGAGFSDAAGLRAGESLTSLLRLSARRRAEGWRGEGELEIPTGALYVDPLYVDASRHPLSLELEGAWVPDTGGLRAQRFTLEHRGVVTLSGEAAGTLGAGLARLAIHVPPTSLGPVHALYLQPWLDGTALGRLEAAGEVALDVDWRRGEPSEARLALAGVALRDGEGRFGLAGVEGTVAWGERTPVPASRIQWRGARLYRLELGPGTLAGRARGGRFVLSEPLTQPIFDGALEIRELEVTALGPGAPAWQFGGSLTPISLEKLSRAFGWPAFSGAVSGIIPLVRYADGAINVHGELSVNAFEGAVAVRNLQLERPFGVVPVLRADVEVEDLSLQALTGAFSFGRIQGHLDGRVRDLVLEDWQPRSFDATFATPPDDPAPHRISQRAIENLTTLGGTGAPLSRTFLRFFDQFSYDRLGLSCRLKDGVCEMSGVEEAPRGYYIVKGGGVPRVDVIGFNRRVDWDTLVERLKRVTRTRGPIVR